MHQRQKDKTAQPHNCPTWPTTCKETAWCAQSRLFKNVAIVKVASSVHLLPPASPFGGLIARLLSHVMRTDDRVSAATTMAHAASETAARKHRSRCCIAEVQEEVGGRMRDFCLFDMIWFVGRCCELNSKTFKSPPENLILILIF